MKKNIKYIIITLIISIFICIPKAFAEVTITAREDIIIDNKKVYKVYDNLATGKTKIIETTGAIIKLNEDGGEYIGYCIDFGININTGKTADVLNLYEYYKNVLSDDETNRLVNKIVLYTRLGYGTEGKTSEKYYLATQQLIWEAIDETGFYQSDFYEQRAGEKFNVENIWWTTDKETKIDISSEINAIKSATNYYYATPSFCSDQSKLEIEVGETVTYTDKNNVLTSYNVTCDNNLTCTTDNNQLTVTATTSEGNNKITFLKPASGTKNVIYRAGTDQGIITNTGILESVSCEFGINAFKNEQTSDTPIVYVVIIGLCSGIMAYIIYHSKKILNGLN